MGRAGTVSGITDPHHAELQYAVRLGVGVEPQHFELGYLVSDCGEERVQHETRIELFGEQPWQRAADMLECAEEHTLEQLLGHEYTFLEFARCAEHHVRD